MKEIQLIEPGKSGSGFLEAVGTWRWEEMNFRPVSLWSQSGSTLLLSAWSCFGLVFLKQTQGKLKLIRVEHVTGPVGLLSNSLNQGENRGKKVRKERMFRIIRNPSKGLGWSPVVVLSMHKALGCIPSTQKYRNPNRSA